jgi:hypothetical protein
VALVLRRLIIAISATLAVAVLAAIALAILDLYLAGHGYAGIRKEFVSWPAAGVHLSIADIALLLLALAAGALAWRVAGGSPK